MKKNALEGRRKILVAIADRKNQEHVSMVTEKHISNCQFYFSNEGLDAISKLNNDTPHILIVEKELPRRTALQITESILSHKQFESVAIIILAEIPDTEHFVDEVVTGRVQFTSNFDINLPKYLARALNYVSHGDNAEFHLAFLAANEVLMTEGDKPDYVYILKKGELKAVSQKTGKDIFLGTVSPGEFVGEMAYINGEPRSASIIATTDCELIEIPVDKLDTLLFQKPAWSKALVKTLSRRVRNNNEKITKKVIDG